MGVPSLLEVIEAIQKSSRHGCRRRGSEWAQPLTGHTNKALMVPPIGAEECGRLRVRPAGELAASLSNSRCIVSGIKYSKQQSPQVLLGEPRRPHGFRITVNPAERGNVIVSIRMTLHRKVRGGHDRVDNAG